MCVGQLARNGQAETGAVRPTGGKRSNNRQMRYSAAPAPLSSTTIVGPGVTTNSETSYAVEPPKHEPILSARQRFHPMQRTAIALGPGSRLNGRRNNPALLLMKEQKLTTPQQLE